MAACGATPSEAATAVIIALDALVQAFARGTARLRPAPAGPARKFRARRAKGARKSMNATCRAALVCVRRRPLTEDSDAIIYALAYVEQLYQS